MKMYLTRMTKNADPAQKRMKDPDTKVGPDQLGSLICNGNWTEWSTIQGVIARVISKSDEREVQGRFEITSTISP